MDLRTAFTLYLFLYVAGVAITIYQINRPRQPISLGTGIIALIFNALIFFFLLLPVLNRL